MDPAVKLAENKTENLDWDQIIFNQLITWVMDGKSRGIFACNKQHVKNNSDYKVLYFHLRTVMEFNFFVFLVTLLRL